jgi:hypothetical protein
MNKRSLVAAIAVLSFLAMALFTATVPTTTHADDFENPKPGAVKWKVVDYNRITTHPARIPYKVPGGIAFDFLYTPDTALLGTSHPSYRGDLLGDMSNKTLSATVGVTVTPGTVFQYYGNSPGQPANVRFYFQTDTSGKFEETDYWWSNPVSINLQTLALIQPADFTMTVPISSPSMWSDYNGHFGDDPAYTAAFLQAVKDVQFVGLSFGGGSFFENGVGIAPGTGSGNFRLMDFTATP